jgi:hypothetical protein
MIVHMLLYTFTAERMEARQQFGFSEFLQTDTAGEQIVLSGTSRGRHYMLDFSAQM